jgi:hypothetical protein
VRASLAPRDGKRSKARFVAGPQRRSAGANEPADSIIVCGARLDFRGSPRPLASGLQGLAVSRLRTRAVGAAEALSSCQSDSVERFAQQAFCRRAAKRIVVAQLGKHRP